MAPIDGPIQLISEICIPHIIDDNILKFQPSMASGLGGVCPQRSKSPALLYKYRWFLARKIQLIPLWSKVINAYVYVVKYS